MSTWVSPKWKDPAFRDKAFWLCVGLVMFGVLLSMLGRNYFIGISLYEVSCIDGGRVMIVDKSRPQSLETIEKGKLAAFINEDLNKKMDRKVIGAKFVAGIEGDKVTIKDGAVFINDIEWGKLSLVDHKLVDGTYETYEKEFVIPRGEIFMLGTTPTSYDGRYWGTVKAEHVIGRAYLVI